MKATKILSNEHQTIRKVLNCLVSGRNFIENGRLPAKLFFETAIAFSQDFSDKFHHFKEEFLVFGVLAQKKQGQLDLEIGALRFQHERCRLFLKEMTSNLEGYNDKDELSISGLLENLSAYVSLLHRHIYLEDNIFFPMAEELISDEENQYLLDQFLKEENRLGSQITFQSANTIADQLFGMISGNATI